MAFFALIALTGFNLAVSILPFQSLTVEAQENQSLVYAVVPDCAGAQNSAEQFISCLRGLVSFAFYIGLGIIFIRVAYVMVISVLGGGKNVFKEILDSIYGLVIGLILILMPVTIMTLINPLAGSIFLNFFGEFSMGPEASLIDVTPGQKGCSGLSACVYRCRIIESGGDRNDCVLNECKGNEEYASCAACFSLIAENGQGVESDAFKLCAQANS